MMREPSRVEQRALDILAVGAERALLRGIVDEDDTLTGNEAATVTLITRQLIIAVRTYGPVILQLAQPSSKETTKP